MLVVSLDTDRGWWRAARPEAHASGSDHAWGGGPRGSLSPRCSGAQRSPGEPQWQGLGSREPGSDWGSSLRRESSEVLSKGRIPENPVQQVGYAGAGSRCGVALLAAACYKAVLRVSAGVRVLNGNP